MNLDFLSLVIASAAAYLLARVWVASEVFEYPRNLLFSWLLRGESQGWRRVGNAWIAIGAGLMACGLGIALGIIGQATDEQHRYAATVIAIGLGFLIAGEVAGHRYFVQSGLECRLCVSVWTSAAVTASLSAWSGWPILPSCLFGVAVAAFATILSFTEGLIASMTEAIDDDNQRKRRAEINELAADPDTDDLD